MKTAVGFGDMERGRLMWGHIEGCEQRGNTAFGIYWIKWLLEQKI